jgi:multidrug transporter EmrE-like cation transporter
MQVNFTLTYPAIILNCGKFVFASVTLLEEILAMSQWILILSAILLNVCGHLFLKAGMNRIGAISLDQLVFSFTNIFSTPFVLLGLFSYVTSVAMYMVVLSKVDVSYAYPLMMGLGYSLIVLFSWQIFGEPFSSFKWTGIALILAGVFVLGK